LAVISVGHTITGGLPTTMETPIVAVHPNLVTEPSEEKAKDIEPPGAVVNGPKIGLPEPSVASVQPKFVPPSFSSPEYVPSKPLASPVTDKLSKQENELASTANVVKVKERVSPAAA
jgi:hypothetical protein